MIYLSVLNIFGPSIEAPLLELKNLNSEGSLFSPAFKVQDKKVPSFFDENFPDITEIKSKFANITITNIEARMKYKVIFKISIFRAVLNLGGLKAEL